ncbi:relaxase/mobilization nuclease domain-containing protein [Anaerotruncus rubiinfantis]|uniref:relaxase/mobilization nuclease domain-containing protein n=1 Tax=Anaerotruncus rubiinfantis TaxID=1720200 RepID=UPI00164D5493|nr:relaxase/mobilization nuclease domain-containing protein [Anaerotruncus rubiinfantis]
MAYTKVFAIRTRLDNRVKYVANTEKTGLGERLAYAADPEKTERRLFVSALNCESPATAYAEMQATKRRFGKPGGVLGYHFIQSFAPGEVTPEQAHQIGVEFARRVFEGRFECIVATHLDRAHLHNHIVINSVSFLDGGKYHSSPESYYNEIRGTSDALCRENALSVIEPKGRGRHRTEWAAAQTGNPTLRGMVQADIDEIIRAAFTFQGFVEQLRKKGYLVKQGGVKHMAVRPPGAERFIRLKSLGDAYTEQAIRERITRQRDGQPEPPPITLLRKHPRRYRIKSHTAIHKGCKPRGFAALYLYYLYLLGKVRRRKAPARIGGPLRDEVLKFQRYQRQFRYLYQNRIETAGQLEARRAGLAGRIAALAAERKPLYGERREAVSETQAEDLTAEIERLTTQLRQLRKELRMCDVIREDAARIRPRLMEVREQGQNEQKQKEVRREAVTAPVRNCHTRG